MNKEETLMTNISATLILAVIFSFFIPLESAIMLPLAGIPTLLLLYVFERN
jgi:hypothetical protein